MPTPESISLGADYPCLVYIDGYSSRVVSMQPVSNQQGKICWKMVLHPTQELIKKYRIPVNVNGGENLYEATLPQDEVLLMNADPSWTRYLYLKTFKGEDTQLTYSLLGISQQQMISSLKQQLWFKAMENDVLKEENQGMKTNMPRYMKTNVTPFLETLAPIFKDIMTQEKKNVGG